MREIRYDREKGYITEKVWRSLLRRFDEKNAVRIKWEGGWAIDSPCVLCKSFRRGGSCRKCPLSVFEKGGIDGCMRLIGGLIHWEHIKLDMSISRVYWSFEHDRIARRQLKKTHKALLGLPKVRKGNDRTQRMD